MFKALYVIVDLKSLFLIFSGCFLGLWIAWPGIVVPNNWKCFKDILDKSKKEQVSLRAVLAVSPNYLLKGKSNNNLSKLRIVSDACFR